MRRIHTRGGWYPRIVIPSIDPRIQGTVLSDAHLLKFEEEILVRLITFDVALIVVPPAAIAAAVVFGSKCRCC